MTEYLKHKTVGPGLTQTEWEAPEYHLIDTLAVSPGLIGTTCYVVASNANAHTLAYANVLKTAGAPVWVCDGTADDAEIKAAIAALPTNTRGGRGRVLFSDGDFTISTPLTIPQYVHLKGMGQDATILSFTGTNGLVSDGTSAPYINKIIVESMTIAGTTVAGTKGVNFIYTAGCVVRDVYIAGFERGIEIANSLFPTFYDCLTQGSSDEAVHWDSNYGAASYNCLWTGSDVGTAASVPFDLNECRNSKIIGGWIEHRRAAGGNICLIIHGESVNNEISGVYFQSTSGVVAIEIDGWSATQRSVGNVISNNYLGEITGDGVLLLPHARGNYIIHNTFESTVTNAVHATGTAYHNHVQGNVYKCPTLIFDESDATPNGAIDDGDNEDVS